MSNGEVCCILGVCCPAGSVAQFDHLVELIASQRPKMNDQQVRLAAKRVLDAHDHFAGVVAAIDQP